MNIIIIQLDSLVRKFLGAYGDTWVATPNLDAFAEKAAVFTNHYVGSLPCMPARREIWAGTQEFWWRGWGPLEPWDIPLPYLARQGGYTSFMVTDHYHFNEWGSHSFLYDFDGYDFIRGHENDTLYTHPISVPDWAQRMVELRGESVDYYLRSVKNFVSEEQFFGPRVMQSTARWIQQNYQAKPFYLHVDSFDVHEPFHVPEPYRSMYTNDDYKKYTPWPLYGRTDKGVSKLSDDEVAWVRAQFAGKLTMVDRWLGQVFDQLDVCNLWDETCVIVTTDHGHMLGEHNWMGKQPAPMYAELCHIPLMIWHPDGVNNGQRVNAITQTTDIYATALDIMGIEIPKRDFIHSRSMLPVLSGETNKHRDAAIYGYSNQRVAVTWDKWTFSREHQHDNIAYWYTNQIEHMNGIGRFKRRERLFDNAQIEAGNFVKGVTIPTWKMATNWVDAQIQPDRDDMLFDNEHDPQQNVNVAEANPNIVHEAENLLREHMNDLHVPTDQYTRLNLD